MIIDYKVVYEYGDVMISVIVHDEECMNYDEISTEAQVTMQREGLEFDTEMLELISITAVAR